MAEQYCVLCWSGGDATSGFYVYDGISVCADHLAIMIEKSP